MNIPYCKLKVMVKQAIHDLLMYGFAVLQGSWAIANLNVITCIVCAILNVHVVSVTIFKTSADTDGFSAILGTGKVDVSRHFLQTFRVEFI